jgi:rare lipoprotein A
VSRRASQLLGFENPGTAKVRVQILAPQSIQAKLIALQQGGGTQVAESAQALPEAPVTTERLAAPPGAKVARTDLALPPPAPPPQPLAPPPLVAPTLPAQVTTIAVRPTSIYVQAGAFAKAENALRLKAKLTQLGDVNVTGATVNGANLYRVRIGPIGSVDEADRLLDRVVDSGVPEARIVVD